MEATRLECYGLLLRNSGELSFSCVLSSFVNLSQCLLQPVPNPFTRLFHFSPKLWHRFEVLSNHFVELVAPFLLLMPYRNLRRCGGVIQIMFQMILISSGNLSFLNWLTIVPALVCLDDAFLMNNLPNLAQTILLGTPVTQSYMEGIKIGIISTAQAPLTRNIVSIAFFLLMAKLNMNVIRNLLARRQVMNGSFDKLRLCGTYGAFGVVAEEREELIIESAADVKGPWKEYQFKVKPGDVHRRPRWISPYHYRLDWQLWIASQTGRIERSPWLLRLLLKLLRQEKDVTDLIESNPWDAPMPNNTTSTSTSTNGDSANGEHSTAISKGSNAASPKYIRIEKYKYRFYDHKKDAGEVAQGEKPPYWVRERIGRYFPRQGILTADMLEEFVNGSERH